MRALDTIVIYHGLHPKALVSFARSLVIAQVSAFRSITKENFVTVTVVVVVVADADADATLQQPVTDAAAQARL